MNPLFTTQVSFYFNFKNSEVTEFSLKKKIYIYKYGSKGGVLLFFLFFLFLG